MQDKAGKSIKEYAAEQWKRKKRRQSFISKTNSSLTKCINYVYCELFFLQPYKLNVFVCIKQLQTCTGEGHKKGSSCVQRSGMRKHMSISGHLYNINKKLQAFLCFC